MENKVATQRKHKDRLFVRLYSEKEKVLEVFNAIFGTEYQLEDVVEFNTLEDFLYMGMKNDVSFLLGNYEVLYEHQSSYNPNMPLRSLSYISKQIQRYIAKHDLKVYGSKLLEIPTPVCIVFYNGTRDQPDRVVQKLSDAYRIPKGDHVIPSLEVSVTCLNINRGRNRELMERCESLRQYSEFVGILRDYMKKYELQEAVARTVDECIEKDILKDLLLAHKAEVKEMVYEEYDEEKIKRWFREEGYEEGIEAGMDAGRDQERIDIIRRMLLKDTEKEYIAEVTNSPITYIEEIEKEMLSAVHEESKYRTE